MRYTLIWHPTAQDDLLSIWLAAVNREEVSDAANAIETTLRIDPVLRGETVAGSIRILIIEPLQIFYRIIEDDRIVQIIAVRRNVE